MLARDSGGPAPQEPLESLYPLAVQPERPRPQPGPQAQSVQLPRPLATALALLTSDLP